jgi:hypothetical protein
MMPILVMNAPPSLTALIGRGRRPAQAERNTGPSAALRCQNKRGVNSMVERERETIVTTDGGEPRGSGGTLLAVVLLIALLVVLFLLFGRNLLGGGETDKIDTPAKGN